MASRPEKKFRHSYSKQIDLLAEMILKVAAEVDIIKNNISLLISHAHTHPNAPVLGQTNATQEILNHLEANAQPEPETPAWIRTDDKKTV